MKQTLENIADKKETSTGFFSSNMRKAAYLAGTIAVYAMFSCTGTGSAVSPSSIQPQKTICPGGIIGDINAKPKISFDGLKFGDGEVKGFADNIDARIKQVVLYAKTNNWYVQPLIISPRTSICSDGSWKNTTHQWNSMVALLVDETYDPVAIRYTDPTADRGVLAWVKYP